MFRRNIISFTIGVVFLGGIFSSLGFGYYLISPAKKAGHDQVFLVREGATLNEVATELESRGIIAAKRLFLLWARLMKYGRQIKSGEYLLNAGMPPVKIFEILRKGAIITHSVTIPEGFTRRQIAGLLEKKGLLQKDAFLLLTEDPDVTKRYGISGSSLEGYLYPDTYCFGKGLSSGSIVDVMVERFWEILGPRKERIAELRMTVEDVVTLASIVEKETGSAEERPVIASVFLNRLKKGMRLESDPTIIYGLKDFDGNLKRRHLSESTPYNTYMIRGLPPGPIANPGLEAIDAVLYPAKTHYLYFVSKNDGSHHFSTTLREHNNAVRKYQIEFFRNRRRKR